MTNERRYLIKRGPDSVKEVNVLLDAMFGKLNPLERASVVNEIGYILKWIHTNSEIDGTNASAGTAYSKREGTFYLVLKTLETFNLVEHGKCLKNVWLTQEGHFVYSVIRENYAELLDIV